MLNDSLFPGGGPRLPSRQSTQGVRKGGPGFQDRLAKNRQIRQWHLVHIKSFVGAMTSKFPSKLYLWAYKRGEPCPPWRMKIAMACLRIILRDEFQTVGNSSLALLKTDVKPTQPNLTQTRGGPTLYSLPPFVTIEFGNKSFNFSKTLIVCFSMFVHDTHQFLLLSNYYCFALYLIFVLLCYRVYNRIFDHFSINLCIFKKLTCIFNFGSTVQTPAHIPL